MVSTSIILAVDLGKYKSVFCWHEIASKETRFQSSDTDPAEFRELLQKQKDITVVIEACSPAGWVHDLCVELSVPILVANTNGDAWSWKNVKRKTDKDDALKLARLAAIGELTTVPIPTKAVRQRKSLIGLRKRFVSERVRGQNRIRGLLVGQGLSAPRGAKAWTDTGLSELRSHAKPLDECDVEELWRGELFLLLMRFESTLHQIDLLEKKLDTINAQDASMAILASVPGVGPRTAEVIVTQLGDAKRFHHADEVSAYAGLVPRQYQSGETDRRGRITKRGSRLLRSAMVECAWCSLRYNAWARSVYERLLHSGVARKKAIIALARKLLIRCWAMLKRGERWQEPTVRFVSTPPPGLWGVETKRTSVEGKRENE